MDKKVMWLFVGVGGTVGGSIPSLWGASMFSVWSIILSMVGGFIGIWAATKV